MKPLVYAICSSAALSWLGVTEAQPTNGLVAHYTFEEGSGSVVGDKSGNKNDGKIHGTNEFVKVGSSFALKFDGKTVYIDCGASKSLNIESAGTVACWFNPDTELQGGLVTRSTSGSWPDERLVLSLRTPNGMLVWALGNGKESQFRQYPDTKASTWTHVALTFDGTNVIFYRDGQRLWAEAQGLSPAFKDVPLIIGRSQGLGEEYFKGMITDVRIYNRALSAQEIIDSYEATKKAFR